MIAKPLTDLLKSTEFAEKFGHKFTKTAKLILGEKETIAFQSLKDSLISAPCLIIYDPTKPTEIWGDASFDTKCVGAVCKTMVTVMDFNWFATFLRYSIQQNLIIQLLNKSCLH